jgi:hypothetical protein
MEAGMAKRVEHYRSRSGTAKLHLALSALPTFTGPDGSAALRETRHYTLYGQHGDSAKPDEVPGA